MDWLLLIAWFGVGAPAYALLKLVSYYLDYDYYPAVFDYIYPVLSVMFYVLLFISFPVLLLVGGVESLHRKRFYDFRITDIKKAIRVAEYTRKPSNSDIKNNKYDCDRFVNAEDEKYYENEKENLYELINIAEADSNLTTSEKKLAADIALGNLTIDCIGTYMDFDRVTNLAELYSNEMRVQKKLDKTFDLSGWKKHEYKKIGYDSSNSYASFHAIYKIEERKQEIVAKDKKMHAMKTPQYVMWGIMVFCLSAIVVLALIGFFVLLPISLLPDKPTPTDRLNGVAEEIGVGGILDYVADRWLEFEIVEHLWGD